MNGASGFESSASSANRRSVVGDADDDAGALLERSVVHQVLRNPDPARGVEGLVVRAPMEAAPHHPALAAEGVELAKNLLLEPGELSVRVHLDAGIESGGENRTLGERRPEAGRDRDPILVVEAVLVVAAKRQHLVP